MLVLDTVRTAIPLTKDQFTKLNKLVISSDAWRWGKVNLYQLKQSTDPRDFISVTRVQSVETIERGSWEKDLIWSIPDRYRCGETFLQVEVSLPKLFYRGENIHLLYEPLTGLNLLRTILNKQFSLRLPKPEAWHVLRADIAYAWKFPSEFAARQTLDCLKSLGFPYKQPIIYNEAIYFPGKTYTVKLYLKLPEFQKHDKKALRKQAAKLEDEAEHRNFIGWIGFLEGKAEGVLRFEVEFHRQWFRDNKIKTFREFLQPDFKIALDDGLSVPELGDLADWFPISLISFHHLTQQKKPLNLTKLWEEGKDGDRITAPAGFTQTPDFIEDFNSFMRGSLFHIQAGFSEITDDAAFFGMEDALAEMKEGLLDLLWEYDYPGGGYTISKENSQIKLLRQMWTKFIGVEAAMTNSEIVEGLLRKKYRNLTAARLLGFWEYLQSRGADRTKEAYGKQIYYRNLRELKAAEVPRFGTREVAVTKEVLSLAALCIPSPFVVNAYTENPDGYDNLFNHAQSELEPNEFANLN